jgi:hypothetical protein
MEKMRRPEMGEFSCFIPPLKVWHFIPLLKGFLLDSSPERVPASFLP